MIKSLYVHIPFCIKKCLYCDFNSISNIGLQDDYINALVKELGQIKIQNFDTVFIGGGTPTILSMGNLERLLKELSRFSFSEYTVECNPGTITYEKLSLMKCFGVNRLSIGLQAWQDELLETLGRIHRLGEFLSGYEEARKCGFSNINIDLMFGIPGQTFKDWENTINSVSALHPEHLSCYSLIIEEGTPFYDMHRSGKLVLPDEDIEREMYDYAVDTLNREGMKQYEISNFAREGYKCRHNMTYWLDNEYIGAGAGAHSYVEGARFSNVSDIQDYIRFVGTEKIINEKSTLSLEEQMSEFMFLGLRMNEGIKKQRFYQRFGMSIHDIYSREIEDCIKNGLLMEDEERIKLTQRGIVFSNQVFVKFLG